MQLMIQEIDLYEKQITIFRNCNGYYVIRYRFRVADYGTKIKLSVWQLFYINGADYGNTIKYMSSN